MKKTTIWKLSALLLSFAMCAAFVGCAPDSGNGPSGDTPSGGQTTDGDNTGDNKDPETPAVVTTVTAEEWKAALTLENVTNVKFEQLNILSGTDTGAEYSITQTMSYVRDGNSLHSTITTTTTGERGKELAGTMAEIGQPTNTEAYFDLENEIIYEKNDEEGFRKIEKSAWGDWEKSLWNILNPFTHIQLGILNSVNMYTAAEYDEEKVGYTIAIDSGTMFFQFENGKLTKVTFMTEGETEAQTVTFTFTYGGQSVTLPAVK